jgi:hypothetical protein
VKIPVLVPPSAEELPVGEAVVPQTVPREVIEAPPFAVTLAPSVTLVVEIELTVGVVIVGVANTAAVTWNKSK